MKERLSDKAECRYCLFSGSFHYVLNVESHFFVRNESQFETQSLHGEQLEEVQELLLADGTRHVVSDQCQYRRETSDGNPAKKPTRWLSSSLEIVKMLEKRYRRKA